MAFEISGITLLTLFFALCLTGGIYWFQWALKSYYSGAIDFGCSIFIIGLFTVGILWINGVITIV